MRGSYTRIWNAEGYCPLHIAVLANNEALLEPLCPREADANLRTRSGLTPYMLCCQYGCFQCGDCLIRHMADPYLLDNDGRSCLAILSSAIEQCADDQERCKKYGFLAQRMLSFAEQYKADCFGTERAVQACIDVLSRCEELGLKLGLLEAELPPVMINEPEPYDVAYENQVSVESGRGGEA